MTYFPETTYSQQRQPSGVTLPSGGFVRLPTVLSLIPVGRSTLWAMVERGDFPRPFKISARVTAWRNDDVLAFVESRVSASMEG